MFLKIVRHVIVFKKNFLSFHFKIFENDALYNDKGFLLKSNFDYIFIFNVFDI